MTKTTISPSLAKGGAGSTGSASPRLPLHLKVVQVTEGTLKGKWQVIGPEGVSRVTCNTKASALRTAKDMETMHAMGARLR